MATFDFCPDSQVPVMMPREASEGSSFNGWNFAAKPTTPFQRSWKLTLHGLYWVLDDVTGHFDNVTNPTINAKRLEEFYQTHETHEPFDWQHPHIAGTIQVRFKERVEIPAGEMNSNGLIAPFDVMLVEHNPGYS